MNKTETMPVALRHQRYYKDICLMTVPLLCMAAFYYGFRPVLMAGVALTVGNLCDRLVAVLRRRGPLPAALGVDDPPPAPVPVARFPGEGFSLTGCPWRT